MPIDPVKGTKSAFVETPPAKPTSQLNMETFMRLLSVQLSNQNPLEPMNDRDFFAQMAQLGQVQGTDQMQKALQVTQATSLIGKTVTATRPMSGAAIGQTSSVTGIAKRLSVRNGEYYLGIEEPKGGIVDVKMSAITEVTN